MGSRISTRRSWTVPPGSDGTRATCRHHPRCPGCPLMGVAYADQLGSKSDRLRRALARYPHLELPEPAPIAPATHTVGYRHRLKLPVDVGRKHVRIGLYDAKHHVLDTPDCPVLAPALRGAIPGLVAWMAGKTGIHSVDLRVSAATGELGLVVACRGGELPGGPRAARELRRRIPQLA